VQLDVEPARVLAHRNICLQYAYSPPETFMAALIRPAEIDGVTAAVGVLSWVAACDWSSPKAQAFPSSLACRVILRNCPSTVWAPFCT
jgi:hypothetical protein